MEEAERKKNEKAERLLYPPAPGSNIRNPCPVTEFSRDIHELTGLRKICVACDAVQHLRSTKAVFQTPTSTANNGREVTLVDRQAMNLGVELCQTCKRPEAIKKLVPVMTKGTLDEEKGLWVGQRLCHEFRTLRLSWDHLQGEGIVDHHLRLLQCCTCNLQSGHLENMSRGQNAGVDNLRDSNNFRARNVLP